MRQSGRVFSVAVIVAVGVNSDGRREVLGMDIGPSEAETFWTAFPPATRQLARNVSPSAALAASPGDRIKDLPGTLWVKLVNVPRGSHQGPGLAFDPRCCVRHLAAFSLPGALPGQQRLGDLPTRTWAIKRGCITRCCVRRPGSAAGCSFRRIALARTAAPRAVACRWLRRSFVARLGAPWRRRQWAGPFAQDDAERRQEPAAVLSPPPPRRGLLIPSAPVGLHDPRSLWGWMIRLLADRRRSPPEIGSMASWPSMVPDQLRPIGLPSSSAFMRRRLHVLAYMAYGIALGRGLISWSTWPSRGITGRNSHAEPAGTSEQRIMQRRTDTHLPHEAP